MSQSASQLAAELDQFLQKATEFWQHYQAVGPGKVDSPLLDGLDRTAKRLATLLDAVSNEGIAKSLGVDDKGWAAGVGEAIETVMRLAHQCAHSPQGLSFVTGEAGLIPNRQQHLEFENQLVNLRHRLDRLA
jgi:hypothetical protein